MNGILIIDKPKGWTSHDVVNRSRRLLGERRIGHTGTLDPMATGVLVLCAGQATRIVRYLESDDKEYQATFRLGITTDTLDADGIIVSQCSYDPPAVACIADVLDQFSGTILQRPPAFSAIKVKGVPSYQLARKGRPVEHQEREVTIHHLTLLEYQDPFVRIRVRCSKGTYVRTLCADIGARLGMGAHVTALVRERSGRFGLEQAISIDELAELAQTGRAGEALLPLDSALHGMPEISLDEAASVKVGHGNAVRCPVTEHPWRDGTLARVLSRSGRLIAVGRVQNDEVVPQTVLA